MHDQSGSVETPISSAPRAATLSVAITPLTKPRRRTTQILLFPLRSFLRRPVRGLAVLSLLALIVLSLGFIGTYLWFDYHLSAARRAVERGHNLAAIRHLHTCRSVRSEHREVLLLCARVARRSGSWEEAGSLLDRITEVHGDDEETVLERLFLRAARGELESAQPLLQARINRGSPGSALAREALIGGLLHRYHQAEAEKQIDDWMASDPNSTMALSQRAKLCEQREQSSEALGAYRRILELDPEFDDVRMRLTAILLKMRQGDEALPHLEYLRKRLPDHAGTMLQFAQALDLTGNIGRSSQILDECLRLDPDNVAALAERGRIARADRDLAKSEEYLSRAVQLDPGNGAARYQYYQVLNDAGKSDEAAKQQRAVAQIEADLKRIDEIMRLRLPSSPNDPALLYEVAAIAKRAGLLKDAERWLLNVLQVDPDHLAAHRDLASYYYKTGNPILSARHRAIAQRFSGQMKK